MSDPAPWGQRAIEMAAIFMIGDGMLGLLQPRRHVALWREDALGTEKLVVPFDKHPQRRRAYGAVQIIAGLALAAALRGDSQRGPESINP
ncbi:hypothetical protein [Sphingomonas sp. RS2018]